MKDLLIAIVAWILGIISSEGVNLIRRRYATVALCLEKLDECSNSTERAIRGLGAGVADPSERIGALTARSDLGVLVSRAFARNPSVSKPLMLFSVAIGACDPESSRAATSNDKAEAAVAGMRDAQQALRSAIRNTRQGRLVGMIGREK